MEVMHGRRTSRIEASRVSTGRVGRCHHTFKSIEWTEGGCRRVGDVHVVRRVHAVQSTIQRKIAVVKMGFTTGGHSDMIQSTPEGSMWCYTSVISVNCGTKYNTISTVCTCRCECRCFHSILRLLLSVNLEQTERSLRLGPLMHCI